MGRLDIFSIPPPHTVASLKNRLVHVEGVLGNDVQLLENEDGEVTLNDGDAIALLPDDFPGSREDQAIVFTYTKNAPDKTTAPEIPSFSKRLTGTSDWGEWQLLIRNTISPVLLLSRRDGCRVALNSNRRDLPNRRSSHGEDIQPWLCYL